MNSLAMHFPEITSQWHPTKNGKLTPYDITAGSNKKVWWKCSVADDHEWEATISNRVYLKQKCPCCSGRKAALSNCLTTARPKIAKQWHPTKNKNLNPNDFTPKSGKRIWWQCKKGHEWEATIHDCRRCPYCMNQKAYKDNCLATKFPKLSSEWHPTKNKNITPENIIAGSNKKYWWICKKNHEWLASPHNRGNTGCPFCNDSKGEKTVEEMLILFNIKFKRQWKFKSCKYKRSLPFDFVIKTKNGIKIIEYQGEQHYVAIKAFGGKTKLNIIQKRDAIKQKWCEDRNVLLLKIPYLEFKNINILLKEFIYA